MNWNYRILSKTSPREDVSFGIHEVYYNIKNKPVSCSSEAMYAYGETLEEIQDDLAKMAKAMSLPVLRKEDFEVVLK